LKPLSKGAPVVVPGPAKGMRPARPLPWVRFRVAGRMVVLYGIHAPVGRQSDPHQTFLAALTARAARRAPTTAVLAAGDWNHFWREHPDGATAPDWAIRSRLAKAGMVSASDLLKRVPAPTTMVPDGKGGRKVGVVVLDEMAARLPRWARVIDRTTRTVPVKGADHRAVVVTLGITPA
jgi:hypothetical protein